MCIGCGAVALLLDTYDRFLAHSVDVIAFVAVLAYNELPAHCGLYQAEHSRHGL